MDNNIIYKNRGETFKCNFDIDGASVDDIAVRLCLEFHDNKNLFFYGSIEPDGDCIVHIPRMSEVEDRSGKMIVEAIVDSTYFRLYECNVELKNSVNVKMKQMEGSFFQNPEQREAKIQLSGIRRETPAADKSQLIQEDETGKEKVVKKPSKGYTWGFQKEEVKEQPKEPEVELEVDRNIKRKMAANPYLPSSNSANIEEEFEDTEPIDVSKNGSSKANGYGKFEDFLRNGKK